MKKIIEKLSLITNILIIISFILEHFLIINTFLSISWFYILYLSLPLSIYFYRKHILKILTHIKNLLNKIKRPKLTNIEKEIINFSKNKNKTIEVNSIIINVDVREKIDDVMKNKNLPNHPFHNYKNYKNSIIHIAKQIIIKGEKLRIDFLEKENNYFKRINKLFLFIIIICVFVITFLIFS